MSLQLPNIFSEIDTLHAIHGDSSLRPIYGAGKIQQPKLCLVFMNPTGRNVSSSLSWSGIQAPWIGTKNVWRLLYQLGLFSNEDLVAEINRLAPEAWTPEFATAVYTQVANDNLYITNIAKCTLPDARHVSDRVYREFLPSFQQELLTIKPQAIISLGNQVSTTLLGKPISVSKYIDEAEELALEEQIFKVYPTYYPVGQGQRNLPKAITRIKRIVSTI